MRDIHFGGTMRFLALLCFFSTLSFAIETPAPGKVLGGSGLVDKSMNPAISLNGLFLGGYGTALQKEGLQLQELEMQFTAAVDPYFIGNFTVAYEGGAFDVEEAYLNTLGLPHVTLKAGKFLALFGKNNNIHTHAQSLIDRPLVNRTILSDESFNSVGAEASILIPAPWYMDLMVGAMSGSQTLLYETTSDTSMALNSHLENLFDLNDQTTLSLGASLSLGDNKQGTSSHYWGVDSTLKYVSGKGKGEFAMAWTNEFISSQRPTYDALTTPEWDRAWGFYSTLLFRLNPRFWAGGRFDYTNVMLGGETKTTGENLILAYVPSEFSALRLQGGLVQPGGGGASQWLTLLQFNMTIGSHPAHAY